MSTYTFVATSAGQGVAWTDHTIWAGNVAPIDDPSAEVDIPLILFPGTQRAYISDIVISSAVEIGSLTLDANTVSVLASLNVAGGVTISGWGTQDVAGENEAGELEVTGAVSAGSIVNDGEIVLDGGSASALNVAGTLTNEGVLSGINGSALTVTALAFVNSGTVGAYLGEGLDGAGLSLDVLGDFENLTSGVLSGGTWVTQGTLRLNAGSLITSLAATVVIYDGGQIDSEDGHGEEALTSTLTDVAAAGVLVLNETGFSPAALSVEGVVLLQDHGFLTPSSLHIRSSGVVLGEGELDQPIVNDGVIASGDVAAAPTGYALGVNPLLTVTGAVSGSGYFAIGPRTLLGSAGVDFYSATTLELGRGVSGPVRFEAGYQTLVLDAPKTFSGRISLATSGALSSAGIDPYSYAKFGAGVGDQIQLDGVALSSVTGVAYVNDAGQDGVLTIATTSGNIQLDFAGDYRTDNFALKAGPAAGELLVVNDGMATTADEFYGQGVSDLLVQDATTGVLQVGQVGSGGQLAFGTVGALGPEWSIEESGHFLGGGQSEFLMETASGAVALAKVAGGEASYTALGALGPEWSFVAEGRFLDDGRDQFMIRNTSGAYVVGDIGGGQTTYTLALGLGSDWTVVGAGDFLSKGDDQLLIENADGAVAAATFTTATANGQPPITAAYIGLGGIGPEWTIEETGDFLGDGKTQFLMQNAGGALVVGEVGNGLNPVMNYTIVGGLGSDWRFAGAGDYVLTGQDSFLIQSTATGALVTGTVVAGQAQYAAIGAPGAGFAVRA